LPPRGAATGSHGTTAVEANFQTSGYTTVPLAPLSDYNVLMTTPSQGEAA